MERDPGELGRQGNDASDEPEDYGPYRPRYVDEGLAAAIEEARADRVAGRGVPHAEVAKWLSTWGKPDFKPMPDEWLK